MRVWYISYDNPELSLAPGWYYFGPREAGLMPKHPTFSSFLRASTMSLGSIAFGSLIVTVLEIIRLLLSFARSSANAEGSREFKMNLRIICTGRCVQLVAVEACLACCAECFVGCIEGMVRYFNR